MKSLRTALAAALVLAGGIPALPAMAHESPEHTLEASRVAAMRDATLAFVATLDDTGRAAVMAELDNNAVRTGWSNLPAIMAPRPGLAVAEMTGDQRKAFHAMLAAAFSSQGYLKTTTIMWHEDVLHQITAAALAAMPDSEPRKARGKTILPSYDTERFYVSVFGDPTGADWGWMVTGHHYAANFTVSDGRIAFTPLFLGASPQVVPEGRYTGWRILQHEADRALALMAALKPDQIKQALIADTVDGKLFAGKGAQDRTGTLRGIPASALDPVQRRLLNALLDEYLADASDEAAARQRAAIAADGPEKLHFAWWGPTGDPAARFMFRVEGPSIIIDYVRERSPDGSFNHVHSIARDPSNDYGARWLGKHYEEAHQE